VLRFVCLATQDDFSHEIKRFILLRTMIDVTVKEMVLPQCLQFTVRILQ